MRRVCCRALLYRSGVSQTLYTCTRHLKTVAADTTTSAASRYRTPSTAALSLLGSAVATATGIGATAQCRESSHHDKPHLETQPSFSQVGGLETTAAESQALPALKFSEGDAEPRFCDIAAASPAESPTAGEPAQGLWYRISAPLRRLGSKREAPEPPVDVPLPMDKLTCKLGADRGDAYWPVLLVACGSFNPPTIMHLRMFELAADALRGEGYDVLGGYISPVNDAYAKPGLAPAQHRVRMAELAVASSPLIMVDSWEAAQPGYSRTLTVMQRVLHKSEENLTGSPPESNDGCGLPAAVQSAVNTEGVVPDSTPADATDSSSAMPAPSVALGQTVVAAGAASQGPGLAETSESGSGSAVDTAPPAPSAATEQRLPAATAAKACVVPRVMLLCGADTVESFTVAGVWQEAHLRQILGDKHGVVCIARRGADMKRLLGKVGTVLHEHASNVMVIEDPVATDISSTKLRQQMAEGRSVRYLTPDAVIEYMRMCGVYDADKQ